MSQFHNPELARMARIAHNLDSKMGYNPPVTWKSWTPNIDCYSTATTAPTAGSGAIQIGSYSHDVYNSICECDFQFAFGTGSSGGSSPALIIGPLPVPMATGVPNWGNASGNDREIGDGYVGKGLHLFVPPIPVIWMQSDAAGKTGGGNNYQYIQGFVPSSWEHGTATVPSTAAFIAVTFVNALPTVPNISDLTIVETSSPLTSGRGFAVTAIATTGFTITLQSTPASPVTFDWTVRSQTTQLLGSNFPWGVGTAGQFDRLSGSLRYQTNN